MQFFFDFLDSSPKKIKSLDPKKGNSHDIPNKILIGCNDIVSGYLSSIYNKDKSNNTFPELLKAGEVIPHFKDEDKTAEKNYRPVTDLLTLQITI